MDGVGSPRLARPGAGSQGALRTANTQRLLFALRDSGPLTQAALARVTGLSTATVSNLVRALAGEGLVATSPTTSSGRRAVLVELADAPTDKTVAGIDIGRRHQRIIMVTLGRELVIEGARPLPAGHQAEDSIEAANNLLTDLLDAAGLTREAVVGCVVGIPGPIDQRSGQIAHGAILPEWVGFTLQERLAQRLGIPVHVDNDANLGALAEITWGPYADVSNLVFIKVGTGIGAGLVLGGRIHRGHIGITGELGHTTVSDYGPMCRCGNRGCLETVASTERMAALLQDSLPAGVATIQDVIDGVEQGNPAALRVVEDAGLALGQVIGSVVNLLNPEVVVIGGPIAPLGEAILEPVRRGMVRHATPAVSATTTVVMSSLGDRAEALGACSHALQHANADLWSPPPPGAMLEASARRASVAS